MNSFNIRSINPDDKNWIDDILKSHWESTKIVSRGKVYQADILPGFIAEKDKELIGLITYNIENDECEIITLDSLNEGVGVGSSLIDAVKKTAIEKGCKRLWVITTNDNQKAIDYYQNRGFRIKTIYKNAIELSRKLKPEIPLIGIDGIPIKDEVELEIIL